MFIIRAIFWLSVVLLFIPGEPGPDGTSARVGAVDALLAVRGVVADLSGICDRQPDVCTRGGAALQAFGARAWQGATTLIARFDGRDEPAAAPDAGTLTPADVKTEWQATRNAAGKA